MGNITDLRSELYVAAIDAFMASQGWGIDGNPRFYSLWGWAPNSYARPLEDGLGGGEITGIGPSISFDGVRQRVDAIIDRWGGLPASSGDGPYATATGNAAKTLGASGTAGFTVEASAIHTAAGTVESMLTGGLIQGSFVAPMLDKYYTQFVSVYQALGAACAVLEINYKTQQEIWANLNSDVYNVGTAARDALANFAATKQAAFTDVTLTFVAAVLATGATVATAGAAAGLVLALAGASAVVDATANALDKEASFKGADYDAIMNAFAAALETIDSNLTETETALNTMLNEALSEINGARDAFDLDRYQLNSRNRGPDGNPRPYPGVTANIAMDEASASIVSTNMDRITESLQGAIADLGTQPASTPSPRPAGIGVSSTGTHYAATSLWSITSQSLTATNAEYGRGKALFDATAVGAFGSDATAETTVTELAADEALTGGENV